MRILISFLLALILTSCGSRLPLEEGSSLVNTPISSTLIVGATIVDGTGSAAKIGNVRIEGDRIVAIGSVSPRTGEHVVDAKGLVLSPGFIDTHSHHEIGLLAGESPNALLAQGVTTIIVGQDGLSHYPLGAFFARFESDPAAVNIASYSGHNAIRQEVMGKDSAGQATSDQVACMSSYLASDMEAGALGFSTGLEYDPGRHATPSEVQALAQVAADFGGRYISHLRSEDREIWTALDELLEIGRSTGMPVQVSHIKLAMTDLWGDAEKFIDRLDRARAEGIDVTGDVYPYPYWQSFVSTLWPDRDFDDRSKAEYALSHLTRADRVMIVHYPLDPSLEGKFLSEVSDERDSDPVTVLIALAKADDAANSHARIIATGMAPADVSVLIAWPHSNIASDGMLNDPHPRGSGTFARIIRQYVREDRLLSLEEAIRKMTGLSAAHVGIEGRGVIQVGAYADLILFDPAIFGDRATRLEPDLVAEGMQRVWVNGVPVYGPEADADARSGAVIRRGRGI